MKKLEMTRGARRGWLRTMLAIVALGVGAVVVPGVSFGAATASVPLTLGKGSELKLEGTSTLHDYESVTHEVRLELRCDAGTEPADAAALRNLIETSGVRSLDVEVPVLTLRSDKSGLDKNLWKNLRQTEFPTIRFHATKVVASRSVPDTMWVRAEGTLTVAGRTQPKTLDARLIRGPEGQWLIGEQPLLMSEFGIRPPTMMMGTLKVKDRVVIGYRLLLTSLGEAGRDVTGASK